MAPRRNEWNWNVFEVVIVYRPASWQKAVGSVDGGDGGLRARLEQWPVAIVVSEVYTVVGEPCLIEDLEFPDRRIFTD